MTTTASQTVFRADLAAMNQALQGWSDVHDDDGYLWIDPAKVPADFMAAYRGLLSYGYANGLI